MEKDLRTTSAAEDMERDLRSNEVSEKTNAPELKTTTQPPQRKSGERRAHHLRSGGHEEKVELVRF